MVSSSIGSNFHRHSGDDERRGIFSKLPPLSIPNGLRRLTSSRRSSKDSPSTKSSTSSAFAGIGSLFAQAPSDKSPSDPKRGSSAATSSTPTSALPLSAFSLPSSNGSSADTTITTPGSGPPGMIDFDIRPGILPDASPGKAYFPVIHTVPETQTKVVTWEERDYRTLTRQYGSASEDDSVLMQRCSKTSNCDGSPNIVDASLNRVEADDSFEDGEMSSQDLERLRIAASGPKDGPASRRQTGNEEPQTPPPTDWDPNNPGHDTWNESGRDVKWQHRSQLFSNLSAFNLRSAAKHKSPTPKLDIGPLCEKIDSTNSSVTPTDLGRLASGPGASTSTGTTNGNQETWSAGSPIEASPLSKHPDANYEVPQVPAKPPRVTLSLPEKVQARPTVALPCSGSICADDEGRRELRQSLFDLSDDDYDLASDEEADTEGDDEEEDDVFNEEIVRTPLPSIDEGDENEVAISVKSRTGKDSLRASILRRTSSHSAAFRPIRSRGESIGLEDCSKDPVVLAAGYEKKVRSRGLTTNDASNKRECFVYRSSGHAGRESWEICPGREALSGQSGTQWKSRNRGETM